MLRRSRRRSAINGLPPVADGPDAASLSPPRAPQYHFATLDPGMRVERRRNLERRARVDEILASLRDDAQRSAYLLTVRSNARTVSIG